MAEQSVASLGKALIALGLEDRFLSNGELSKFPLSERGRIANDIIDENLRLGSWEGVVLMMYGDLGKADALFDGDRDKLRDDIVKSAKEHTKPGYIGREPFAALKKAGENDLLFRLATNISALNLEDFDSVVRGIDSSYFGDAEQGVQRMRTLHQTAANKAMKERNYGSAFHHFTKAGDNDGIGEVFEATLAHEDKYSQGKDLLEKMALVDPTQREERLKRIVLSSISEDDTGLSPLKAFQLSKRHSVALSSDEREALQKRVAESVSRYDIGHSISQDLETRLLWAKKHAKDEPRAAYGIFTQQQYNRNPVITAVQAGLGMDEYQNEERVLDVSEVCEPHLRRAYKTASFDVKVKIATHLKDSDELQGLSRQAHEKSDLDTAYSLWVAGGGNLDGDYIGGIRTKLIEVCVEDYAGSMFFLDNSDTKGMSDAFDTLMETGKGERTDNLRTAYEVALKLGDEARTQKAREAMVTLNPILAIREFTGQTRGNDDKGLDYALGVVASEHGVEKGKLRQLVDKYQTA